MTRSANAALPPAACNGAFDIIRELYASLPETKHKGYTGTFSFNTRGSAKPARAPGESGNELMPDTHALRNLRRRRYGLNRRDPLERQEHRGRPANELRGSSRLRQLSRSSAVSCN